MVAGTFRTRWLPAGLVLALAFAFFELRLVRPITLPQNVGRQNGDLYTGFYPMYCFAYRGERLLPAWNPYQLAGTPFRGLYVGGLLYPPNLLAAIVPVHRAMGYLIVFHLALAGLGMLVLGWNVGLSPPAAMIAAVTFMLNVFLVAEHLRPTYLDGLAWIPLVSLLAGRLVAAPSASRATALGVALALQFLTGHAQIVCYQAYVLCLVAAPVYIVSAGRWQAAYLVRLGVTAALAASSAALLAALQLLPTLEVLSQAVRNSSGLTLEQTMPQTPGWWFVRAALASGGLAALLVPFAMLAPATRRPLIAVCMAVALFAGAVGTGTVLYRGFFFLLPGVALFRLPHEILLIAAVALSVLAGVGLDVLRSRPSWYRLGGGLVASALVAVALGPALASLAAAIACLAAMLLLGRARRAHVRGALAWALLLMVAGERFASLSNRVMIPPVNDEAFFQEPSFVRVLRDLGGQQRILVVKDWRRRFPIMEKSGSLWRLPVVQDYEPLSATVYQEFLRPLEANNPDAPLFWGRFTAPASGAGWRPLDLLSTRYVVVAPTIAPWPSPLATRFREIYRGQDATIYENLLALPRAYLVSGQRVLPDPHLALATLMSDRFDPQREVVVERPIDLPAAPDRPEVPAEVAITRVSPETVTLTVATPRPALLVLTDLFWPGWTVTVDGVPREIHRANRLFRAVALEPGHHDVTFTYAPAAARIGTALTALAVTILAVWAVASCRRRARSERSPLAG